MDRKGPSVMSSGALWHGGINLDAAASHAARHETKARENGETGFKAMRRRGTDDLDVRSTTTFGKRYTVKWLAIDGLVFTFCNCRAGEVNGGKEPVVCWHGAAALLRLEDDGQVAWHNGLWWIPAR